MNKDIRVSDQIICENPKHIKYMFEFRTRQCNRFQEHKCPFHKPFNCFDWHFPNQRRRVPVIKSDGTFNYNPDLYCNTYDQSSGKCSNGQNCQYVHMNAGDTERRYHPRYFKTGMCIYETNADGTCGKNGIHCAFAHNQCDLRSPILDIRESFSFTNNLSAQLEKERVLSEDPMWNDVEYVLAYYKTMECKKQPKTCRQGYACPYYHNSKDKRRMLNIYSYQSQPCVYLKPNNDEWQDVAFCPNQDNCAFSHSRTEQQFHSEIFKSSKCNDMIKENYCPRGPFCAFAHSEDEINNGQYISKMDNGFLKSFELLNITPNSKCLIFDESKSQANQVFHSDQKIPQSSSLEYEKKGGRNLKLFDESILFTSESDQLNSALTDNQTKDISKNLKHILERALSDSCNVSQMSDLEMQGLPELLMKFSNVSNGEELHVENLPAINEWIDECDDSSSNTEVDRREDSENESNSIASSQASQQARDAPLLNKDKILLHKEILETKNKLIKAEEDLQKTRYQLNSIFAQLKKFLNWLEKSDIKDSYKKEINIEISIIIKNLGIQECLNDRSTE